MFILYCTTKVLTDLLDGGGALPKHAQSSMNYLPVELPCGAVVSKGNVFPTSG